MRGDKSADREEKEKNDNVIKKSEKIFLSTMLRDLLLEIGDMGDQSPYDIKTLSKHKAEFFTNLGKKVNVEIQQMDQEMFEKGVDAESVPDIFFDSYNLTKKNKDLYNLTFDVNGSEIQGAKTDLKGYFKIMKTVLTFVNSFVEEKKPFAIIILADEKSEKDTKKRYYGEILKQNINKEYRILDGIKSNFGHEGYIIMRSR